MRLSYPNEQATTKPSQRPHHHHNHLHRTSSPCSAVNVPPRHAAWWSKPSAFARMQDAKSASCSIIISVSERRTEARCARTKTHAVMHPPHPHTRQGRRHNPLLLGPGLVQLSWLGFSCSLALPLASPEAAVGTRNITLPPLSRYTHAQDATMPIDQLGDLDHEKLITAGLLLQGVRKRREGWRERKEGGKEGIETG